MTVPIRPLGQRRAVWLMTRREFVTRVRSKAFIIGLVTTVALIFGAFGLSTLVGGNDPIRLGLVGDQPAGVTDRLDALATIGGEEVTTEQVASRDAAAAAIEAGDLDAAVVDGSELVMKRTDDSIVRLVVPAWQQAALVDAMGGAGLDQTEVASVLGSADPLAVTELEPDPNSGAKDGVAFASVVLLFLAIQLAGAYIMMGVFEEKSTKVVELVLAAVRARDLLAGKVLGIGLLGLIQVLTLVVASVTAAAVFGSNVLPTLSVSLLATSVVWFLLGYVLYGSVFAAGSSLAPRQEDAQATLGPISIVLMLSYFGAIFAASSPDSVAAKVISWIPLTAPFSMPGRLAAGDAAAWEVAGSMVITAVAAFGVLLLAERIYVRSVIHTDRKLGWREAWSMRD